MGYLTAKQFSEKWGISERRIIKLCKENRINGAIKNGMVWLMPEDTIKPSDKRSKISKYINTQKRIMIVNINTQLGIELMPLLERNGYIINGIYNEKTKINLEEFNGVKLCRSNYNEGLEKILLETEKYYDGLIYIEDEDIQKISKKETLIRELAKKMDCEGSIILVNNGRKEKLEQKLSKELKENIGIRINAINIETPNKNVIINYNEIAEDVISLLTKFKNTTGMAITTDGGYLEFDNNGRTKPLNTGKFYKTISNYFKRLDKESHLWCASTMLEDEWTEEPLEMNFRVNNLEAANRGANLERIFIFSKSKIKEYKNNKTLKVYMQSNIKTMFVDYDEVMKKDPKLLEILGDGWDGIDQNTLIVDLPSGNMERGYISINKKEVEDAYNCFLKLKKYSKDLKEILK